MPPHTLFLLLFFFLPSSLCNNDFGGDFSSTSLSGGTAPGPTAGTMGDKSAAAMAIGTGGSGPGNYAANFKTPNYTQYTNQDFKEFLPNYEDMMEKSMTKGRSGGGDSAGGAGAAGGFGNFSNVNEMLKGFMDLQKEQLKVEKAKAEANKAKVDLALDYDEDDYIPEGQRRRRRKRSFFPSPFLGERKKAKKPSSASSEQSFIKPVAKGEGLEKTDTKKIAEALLRLLLNPSSSLASGDLASATKTALGENALVSLIGSARKPPESLLMPQTEEGPISAPSSKWYAAEANQVKVVAPSSAFAALRPSKKIKARPMGSPAVVSTYKSTKVNSPLASLYRLPTSTRDSPLPTTPNDVPTAYQTSPSTISPPRPPPPLPAYVNSPSPSEQAAFEGYPSAPLGVASPSSSPPVLSNQRRQSWPGAGSSGFSKRQWPGMGGRRRSIFDSGDDLRRQTWPGMSSSGAQKRQSWPGMPSGGSFMRRDDGHPHKRDDQGHKRQSWPGMPGTGFTKRQGWPGAGSSGFSRRQSWPGMGGTGFSKRQSWPGMGGGSGFSKRQSWPGMGGGGKMFRRSFPGATGKYFKRQGQSSPSQAPPPSPPPSSNGSGSGGDGASFWESIGTKASSWFKNGSPGGTQGSTQGTDATGSSMPAPGSSDWANGGGSGGAPASPPPWAQGGSAPSPPAQGSTSVPSNPWSGMPPSSPPPPSPSQGGSAPPPAWSSGGSQGSNSGGTDGSNGGSSNQRRRQVAGPGFGHGAVSLSNIPGMDSLSSGPPQTINMQSDLDNIPSLSFSLNPSTPKPPPPPEPTTERDFADELEESYKKVARPSLLSPVIGNTLLPPPRRRFRILSAPSSPSSSPLLVSSLLHPLPNPISINSLLPTSADPRLLTGEGTQSVLYANTPFTLPGEEERLEEEEEEMTAARTAGLLTDDELSYFPSPSASRVLYSLGEPIYKNGYPVFTIGSPSSSTVNLYRLGRGAYGEDEEDSPLVIYKVEKDEFGRPEKVKKILLDPKEGIIIDENKQGDMYLPTFPSGRRRKREAVGEEEEKGKDIKEKVATTAKPKTGGEDMSEKKEHGKFLMKVEEEIKEESIVRARREAKDTGKDSDDDMDPNGHKHKGMLGGDQIEAFKDFPAYASMFRKRGATPKKTYQYQKDGSNTDYDYDVVQEEGGEDNEEEPEEGDNDEEFENVQDEQTRLIEINGENEQVGQPQEERKRRRRVKIDFVQKSPTGLPPGTVETVSAGGGKAPGHHEGGGISVKIKIPPKMHGRIIY